MTRDDIALLLPEMYRRGLAPGTPLSALLSAMEALLAPLDAALAVSSDALHPDLAPARFVTLLAYWTDLDRFLTGDGSEARFAPGVDQLRALVRAVPELARWRGTARGLRMFLETATGVAGFVVNDRIPGPAEMPIPFHFQITAPAGAALYRDLVEQIVMSEKPAYVTHDIVFGKLAMDNKATSIDKPPKGPEPRPQPEARRS